MYGVWAITRKTKLEVAGASTEDVGSREEQFFGAAFDFPEDSFLCVEDNDFMEFHWSWDGMIGSKEDELFIEDAIPCTRSNSIWRRAQAVQFTPVATLPEDPSDWPRNVKIANEALPGSILENIMAGIEYEDDRDRENFLNLWQWFPKICSEKPEDSEDSYMDICRQEFIGLMVLALTSEQMESEFQKKKLIDVTQLSEEEAF